MKHHRQELWFETPTRVAFVNITPEVEAALRASGIREGLCLVKEKGDRFIFAAGRQTKKDAN